MFLGKPMGFVMEIPNDDDICREWTKKKGYNMVYATTMNE